MMINGFILDVEDVFFDGTFFHRTLHQMIRKCGCPEEFGSIQSIWQNQFLPRVYEAKIEYWDALASFFASMGLQKSLTRELITGAKTQLKKAQGNLRLYPDVEHALAALKNQGNTLAVLCNSIHDPDKMSDMLRRIGMRTKLDFILTSFAARRVMPDRDGFITVCQAMGVEPKSIAYVSTRETRLQIANDFGLQSIQLLRSPQNSTQPADAAHCVVNSLLELANQASDRSTLSRMAV